MKKEQLQALMEYCSLPDSCEKTELIETHISWIILTDNFAFKIKRPVSYSFVDFSSLQNRKYYCYEELELNRRIEPDMYVKVIEVTKDMLAQEASTENKEVIDYAVQMRKMDNDKEMVRLLQKNEVDEEDILKLAVKIAGFHNEARIIKNAFNTTGFQEKFADIETLFPAINEKFGKEMEEKISSCIQKSHTFLNKNRSFFNERAISGFRKDIHGDLNARNIFLYETPVMFDCIEFNKDLRQIDIMNEIAFLCVDLDFYGKEELSEKFFREYCELCNLKTTEQKELFTYYKSYRANVQAKVTLLNAQEKEGDLKEQEFNDAEKYLQLMKDYCNML